MRRKAIFKSSKNRKPVSYLLEHSKLGTDGCSCCCCREIFNSNQYFNKK